MTKVVVSDQVRAFLESEKAYLNKHSTTARKRFVLRIAARKLLSAFPRIGAERTLPVAGVRRLVVGDYLLDYEVDESTVFVLSMRHGRQNDPTAERDEDFDFEV